MTFFINAADAPFNALANGTDQTAAVQAALSSLGTSGGTLQINRGTSFNKAALVMPKCCNIEYFATDEITGPMPAGGIGTNEKIYFAGNANDGGIVNEWRFTATYHPGLIIDVRKDDHGHDAYLGTGQNIDNPARASINIHDERVNTFRIAYEGYNTQSNYSAVNIHSWARQMNLHGIGTSDFVSLPAYKSLIVGQTSGARGLMHYTGAGYLNIFWIKGAFLVGEKLIYGSNTTTATLTSIDYIEQTHQGLCQSVETGNWSFGLVPGSVREILGVGGDMGVAKTKNNGQFIHEQVDNPSVYWIDDHELAIPNGFQIKYDTSVDPAHRRLYLTKYRSNAKISHIGAVSAYTNIENGGVFSASAFNVASVVKPYGTVGYYVINFINPIKNADYVVSFGPMHPLEYPTTYLKTNNTLYVQVFQTGTTTPRDLTNGYPMGVTCLGGDI